MGVYTHSNGNWLSRRGGFMVALILFHIVLFWALKSGLAVKLLESITEPIKVDIVNEVKEEEPPPPPPPPKMELPPVEVPRRAHLREVRPHRVVPRLRRARARHRPRPAPCPQTSGTC